MYDTGRFFTVTGQHLPGTPHTVEERQVELEHLHAQIFGAKHHARQTSSTRKTPQDFTHVKEALTHIPAVDYDVWLRVGMGLQNAGDENFDLWVEWSKKCPEKFDESVCHKKWTSFSADRDSAVTVATIIQLAKEHGWRASQNGHREEPPWPSDDDAPKGGFSGSSPQESAENEDWPDPEPLPSGLLPVPEMQEVMIPSPLGHGLWILLNAFSAPPLFQS